jgi:hypothetical protein
VVRDTGDTDNHFREDITMAKQKSKAGSNNELTVHPARPDWPYHLPQYDKTAVAKLAKPTPFPLTCTRPCTEVRTLLPKSLISGHSGMGYFMNNVDGYRYINAYVISDPLTSSLKRGFSLELSFSPYDFVYGVGVVGETSFFFNFDTYFDPGTQSHKLIQANSSDLTTTGGLPWIGGIDLSHIVRVPVMGPFVRASAFNEDSAAHNVQVVAYLTT